MKTGLRFLRGDLMASETRTTVTTVQELDADGNVVSEKVTTTVVETVVKAEAPRTGMYL